MGGPKVPIPFSSSTESESVPIRVWNFRHPALLNGASEDGPSYWMVDPYARLSTEPKEMSTPRRRFVRQGVGNCLENRCIKACDPVGSFLDHHSSAALLSRLPSRCDWTILRLQGRRAPGATPSTASRHCCSSLLHSHRRRQRRSGRHNRSSQSSSCTIQPGRRSCWASG